jgi:hypothetical protein
MKNTDTEFALQLLRSGDEINQHNSKFTLKFIPLNFDVSI